MFFFIIIISFYFIFNKNPSACKQITRFLEEGGIPWEELTILFFFDFALGV